MCMTHCDSQSISGIVGLWRLLEPQKHSNHCDHLLFLSSSVTNHRLLYLKRGIFKGLDPHTVCAHNNNTSCFCNAYTCCLVCIKEQLLNSHVIGMIGLYLLTILMQQPNLLILDEPTNDLDIVTLNILEEYLKEFGGSLIIVSHDRHFLDKLVDHLFIFCGNGVIKDFVGSYSEYREYIKEYEAEQRSQARAQEKAEKDKAAKAAAAVQTEAPAKKKKLTYKEQKELEQIEKDLEALGAEKAELEEKLSAETLPFDQLQAASERIGQIMEETDEKEMRWLELTDGL